jgi:hypothetical protein
MLDSHNQRAALAERNRILHASVGELMLEGKTVLYGRRKKGPVPVGQSPVWESTLHGLDELDEIGARLFKADDGGRGSRRLLVTCAEIQP